ncbi:MAG: hypothetical protein J07AB43_01780 [Candidatus Nanosalina sp. J07AB43]|jgi:hypothetical protein|nr:MAG: hypothetical protein J07AB43_01780 [Candidatus Nanosalina sp. J07AB43]
MNTYNFSTESDEVIEQIDNEFKIVTVVGSPESGFSSGFDLVIYDDREEHEIHKAVEKIKHSRLRN